MARRELRRLRMVNLSLLSSSLFGHIKHSILFSEGVLNRLSFQNSFYFTTYFRAHLVLVLGEELAF